MTFAKMGKYFGDRRKILGLRQEDLSEMCGITKRTIYNIEAGKGNPSYKTLLALCEVLGLEMAVGIKTAG